MSVCRMVVRLFLVLLKMLVSELMSVDGGLLVINCMVSL